MKPKTLTPEELSELERYAERLRRMPVKCTVSLELEQFERLLNSSREAERMREALGVVVSPDRLQTEDFGTDPPRFEVWLTEAEYTALRASLSPEGNQDVR
jgi:hypothetical protein